MTLQYVALTLDLYDGQGNPVITGSAAFTPSAPLTDAGVEVIGQDPVPAVFHAGRLPQVSLLATDSSGPSPAGWTWGAAFSGQAAPPASFSFFLPANPMTFTATHATPCVFTGSGTAYLSGTGVQLSGGSVPAGFTAGVTYYVVSASGSAFELAATAGGPALASTGTGSGSVTAVSQVMSNLVPVASGSSFYPYMPEVTTTLGDTIYGGVAGAPARLPGNTSAVQALLAQAGTGSASAAPVWLYPAAVTAPQPSGDETGATDQVAITAIENGLTGLGGGVILFSAGTYWVTGLTKQSGITWQCAGRQVTTIKLAASGNADVVQGANFGTLTGTGSYAGIAGWSIRDCTIDGNRANQSGPSWGLRVYSYDHSLHNVTVTNCYSDGMWTEWGYLGSISYGGSNPDSMESVYSGVKCCFNGGWGWHNRGPHDSVAVGCIWFDNNVTAGTAGNLWSEDDRATQHFLGGGLQCLGCHSWGNGASWGIIADSTLIWSGGSIEGATYGAILVRGNLDLSASKVFYNSVTSAAAGAGIQLGDDGSTPGVPSSFAFTTNSCRISSTGLDNFAGAGRSSAALAWVSCNHSSVDVHCNPQAPTVASGSNGQAVSSLTSSQLIVSTTTGWPASGTVYVQTSSGYAKCTYTSVTGGGTPSFNGVSYVSGTGGASTVATGGLVTGDPLGGTSPDQYSTVRIDQGTGTSSGIRGALSVQQAPGPVKTITGALASAWHIQNAASGDLVNLNTAGTTPFLQVVGAILQGYTANYGTMTCKVDPTTGAVQPGTTAGAGGHVYSGSGAPSISGSVTGDTYHRTDVGSGRSIYKATGANTWGTLLGADLPAATTSVQGAVQLDGTASDIQPTGTQAAGGSGLAADAKHVHFCSGSYLAAPSQYAPSSRTTLTTSSQAMGPVTGIATTVASGSNGGEISQVASWSTPSAGVLNVANATSFPPGGGTFTVATSSTTATCTYTGTVTGQLTGCAYVSGSATGTVSTGGTVTLVSAVASTGSFTAPASGSVVVTVQCMLQSNTNGDTISLGLAARGTITPMIGYSAEVAPGGAVMAMSTLVFYVTGLTPGASYDLDLLWCCQSSSTASMFAWGQTSTTPTQSETGGPVTMTVQAV
jgi:hypothetical protein